MGEIKKWSRRRTTSAEVKVKKKVDPVQFKKMDTYGGPVSPPFEIFIEIFM